MHQLLKYTQSDGLSSYNIHKILSDKRDFIWIATQDGLNRFDGNSFVKYTKNSNLKTRLSGTDIRDILIDTARNVLWVLPDKSGIDKIDLNTGCVIQTIAVPHEKQEEWNMSLALCGDRLWIGTTMGLKIYNLNTNKFESTPDLHRDGIYDPDKFEARGLLVDNYMNVWAFFSGYGIMVFNGHSKAVLAQVHLNDIIGPYRENDVKFFSGFLSAPGNMLVGTSQGLRSFTFDAKYKIIVNKNPCTAVSSLNTEPIEGLSKMDKGSIMVSNHSALYCLKKNLSEFKIFRETGAKNEGVWINAVQYIWCDAEDNLWLGCQQGLGLIRSKPSPFTSWYLDEKSNCKLEHVRSLCALGNGGMSVGLRNGIAVRDNAHAPFKIFDQQHLYHHIFEWGNKLIVSREDGLFTFQNDRSTPLHCTFPEFIGFDKIPVNSHVILNDSVIVLGSENDKGILVWNFLNHTVVQYSTTNARTSLSSKTVNNLFKDHLGRLWVLSDYLITIISPDLSESYTLKLRGDNSTEALGLFFDMCESNGHYWIACYGNGILKVSSSFRLENQINIKSGLSNDGVYQVFPLREHLVVTSNQGISLLNFKTLKVKRYYEGDGLHSNSFEEVAGVMHSGLIYAGGVRGCTIIDPFRFSVNKLPAKLYINRIVVDRVNNSIDIDTSNFSLQELTVPNDVLQTSIYLSAINYGNSREISFAYRIIEINNEWVSNGKRNFINLVGLSPGTYHIEVKAANEDAVWSQPISLSLIYAPKWYQTWWFRTLLLCAILALCYGFYRMRINQILGQQKIRKEVASDLHDDIGSTLNSVKLFANLARNNPYNKSYLQNVEENLHEATIGLRDMIWILDDKLDTVNDLCTRLRSFAVKPAEALGITVHFDSSGAGQTIVSKGVKRNIFLIAKEAINNSIKYAQGQNIWIDFKLISRKLVVTIKDDGRGFDSDAVGEGYGLTNIKNRALQIDFNCRIRSSSSGTEISISEK